MDYLQTLDYLYQRLPMFQRVGAQAFKKDLTNTRLLCEGIGHPQRSYPCLHIAGTNGKGSVSSMLCSILMEAGYRTGLYTSPHLHSFTERIRVNGQEIPAEAVVQFVKENKALIERVEPSFFEVTVAMAFDHFAREKVDIAVIEVGLGGRLDSTNIIIPELSVITSISFDHQAMLGNTLAEIAGEKAGIIKKDVPVVVGETLVETAPVFKEKAHASGSELVFADQVMEAQRVSGDWREQVFKVSGWPEAGQERPFRLGLAGHYQSHNLLTTLAAVGVLRKKGWELSDQSLEKGLIRVKENSGLAGRMQVVRQSPLVLTDIAHNEAGIREVFSQFRQIPHTSLHIVWGMVDDKDHEKILALLPKEAHYYFVRPNVPRGLDAGKLQELATRQGLSGNVFVSVEEGLRALLAHAGDGSLGYIGGSTFVVAEIPEEMIEG